MLATAVIGRDGPDPSRRAAFRDRHIAAIAAFAAEGRLLLGLPLHAQGQSRGSLMVVAGDPAAYLAQEPFAAGGVWQETICRPIRIPVLPWKDWPAADAPLPSGRGHSILFAAGDARPERLGTMAARGELIFAAETLDAPGAILVTAHAQDAAAAAWIAGDALLSRCAVEIHATLFRPLPYRPLPGAG